MYSLLVIEKPDCSIIEKEQAWNKLQRAISGNLSNIGDPHDNYPKRLGENVLLIPLNEYMNIFVEITSVAQNNQLSYQVLFLEREPEWIYSK